MKRLVVFALLLRLMIAPLVYHGDVIDTLNWSKNLSKYGLEGFYYRDTPDAVAPNYPPLYYELFYVNQKVYEVAKNGVWKINTTVALFPSIVYVWFASDAGNIFFNKLPGILADLGITFVIFRISQKTTGKEKGKKAASLYLISLPVIYLSSLWGQTESIWGFLLLTSVYYLTQDDLDKSSLFYLLSLLVKPLGLLVAPIYIFLYFKNILESGLNSRLVTYHLSLILIFLLIHLPFDVDFRFGWIGNLYKYHIREFLGYSTANAFNLWGLVLGFRPIYDFTKFLGIPYLIWGVVMFAMSTIFILVKLGKKPKGYDIFLAFGLTALSAYLFLTRMHERYLFLAYLLLIPVVYANTKIRKLFGVLSVLLLINLYHFWWTPKINILITLLSNTLVEKALIVCLFVVYFRLLKFFAHTNNSYDG